MKFKVEIHLSLLVIYSIVVNFKNQSNFIDGIIIVSILASMLYQMKLDHDTLPDIRKETETSINELKKELEGKINTLADNSVIKFSKLEKDTTDIKNAVAPFLSGRSVGLSNTQLKF